jgi:cell division protein FtsB
MTIHSEYDAFDAIIGELHRARKLHPVWPGDPIHAAAIVTEEAGEFQKAVNDWMTGKGMLSRAVAECVETGAMAIRFLTDTPALHGVTPVTEAAALRQSLAEQDATIQALRAENARLAARLEDAVSGLLTAPGKTQPVDHFITAVQP